LTHTQATLRKAADYVTGFLVNYNFEIVHKLLETFTTLAAVLGSYSVTVRITLFLPLVFGNFKGYITFTKTREGLRQKAECMAIFPSLS
jgi:hypothetical protein